MEVQGNDIIILLREAGDDGAYKKMVCEVDNSFKLTNDVTEKDTKCGTKVGIKPAKANISGNATHNISPTEFEVSYQDVADWQLNETLLEYKYVNAEFTDENGDTVEEGDVVYFHGNAYFIDSEYKGATGEVADFSWTLKPSSVSNVIASS